MGKSAFLSFFFLERQYLRLPPFALASLAATLAAASAHIERKLRRSISEYLRIAEIPYTKMEDLTSWRGPQLFRRRRNAALEGATTSLSDRDHPPVTGRRLTLSCPSAASLTPPNSDCADDPRGALQVAEIRKPSGVRGGYCRGVRAAETPRWIGPATYVDGGTVSFQAAVTICGSCGRLVEQRPRQRPPTRECSAVEALRARPG